MSTDGVRVSDCDLSTVIDWLIDNAPVDANNIGSAGISYGSGLSLLGAAHDERIKTVVCMSGWSDLLQAFWSQQTPREVCAKVLVTSSDVAARTDDQLSFLLNSLLKNQHMKQVKAWAKERSPAAYLRKYNKRQPPIYLIQNLQDELFQPNALLDFYGKLQGPKRIDLNMGTHASAEISGILGLQNHLWKLAHDWFDYWLRGLPNDIMPLAVSFELVATCYEVREGHHLILVMDTSDLQYKIPTKDEFKVTFHYGAKAPPRLDLPFAETELF